MPDETTHGARRELKLVGDIAGSFRVSRYQRGYRWGRLEVERLLNDVHRGRLDTEDRASPAMRSARRRAVAR